MSCEFVVRVNRWAALLLLTVMTPVLADGQPPGGQDPTRPVRLPQIQGAPVVIDSAYIDIVSGGLNGEVDAENVGCVRYRNVGSEPIVQVLFERTYFDASGVRLGSDSVEDHATRKPNPNAKPGTGPVGDAYWDCTHTPNPYGPKLQSASIAPGFVKFWSGKTWRP